VAQADVVRVLLAREPVTALPADAAPRETIRLIALDPAYQLK
jgi:hypothetical protein